MRGMVIGCHIIRRKGETLFHIEKDSGIIHPALNGYTIIANEYYERIVEEVGKGRVEEIIKECSG